MTTNNYGGSNTIYQCPEDRRTPNDLGANQLPKSYGLINHTVMQADDLKDFNDLKFGPFCQGYSLPLSKITDASGTLMLGSTRDGLGSAGNGVRGDRPADDQWGPASNLNMGWQKIQGKLKFFNGMHGNYHYNWLFIDAHAKLISIDKLYPDSGNPQVGAWSVNAND